MALGTGGTEGGEGGLAEPEGAQRRRQAVVNSGECVLSAGEADETGMGTR